MRSPKPPESSHPRLPQTLTEPSRKGSPGASCKGSPAVPAKAHRPLPYRLTRALPERLTYCSRKTSPLRRFACCGCRMCGSASRNIQAVLPTRETIRPAIRLSRTPRSAHLSFLAGHCALWRCECSSRAILFGCRSVASPRCLHCIWRIDRAHYRRTRERPRKRDYGCNFILNPTTPGSSVVDTAKPHDFASEIIAVFSRNASPTIHAVPRDRAYSMMRVIIRRPSPLPF